MLRDRARCADGISRTRPAAAGVSSKTLAMLLDEAQASGMDLHAVLIYRRLHLAVEAYRWPYTAGSPRIMHSVTKSFTACAIGLALAERRFRLTDRVVSFFPEHVPSPLNPKLAAMTVRDLLTMRTGHAGETSGSRWRGLTTSWIAEFFKIPVVHAPGEVYVYTSAASYMLSAILTRTTGETLHQYLKPRLFEPLGFAGESWDLGPDGINPGGNGLACRAIDLLKFGVLHMQQGVWKGERLLPKEWIAEATRSAADSPYGFHWWTGPEDEFYAMGLFGQLLAVLPRHDAVIVVTSATGGANPCSEQLLPLLRKYLTALLPGGDVDGANEDSRIEARLRELAKPPLLASPAQPNPELRGYMEFDVAENSLGILRLIVDLSADDCTLRLLDASGEHAIRMGIDRWIEGETDMPGDQLHHGYRLTPARVAAGARWRTANTLEMTWIFEDTAFRDTVVCGFTAGGIGVSRSVNVNSGLLRLPELRGQRSKIDRFSG